MLKKTKLKLSDFKAPKKQNGKAPKKPKPEWKRSAERRLSDWQQFLKDDVDYDYFFILRVLKYKIGRVRTHILEHDVIADAKKVAVQMKEVEDLLEKVMNDKYADQYVDPVMKKMPIDWYKSARNQAMVRNANKKAGDAKVADLRKAMILISKNIWGWWD